MDKEAQRIAIAEACGWKEVWKSKHDGKFYGLEPSGVRAPELPDYLNNLNAMHAAIADRNEAFKNRFEWTLSGMAIEQDKYLVEMSAKEWSEAFLQTLGLWKDDASNLNTVARHAVSINP